MGSSLVFDLPEGAKLRGSSFVGGDAFLLFTRSFRCARRCGFLFFGRGRNEVQNSVAVEARDKLLVAHHVLKDLGTQPNPAGRAALIFINRGQG